MKNVQTPSTAVVPAERRCPRCGAALGGFGPEGLCGACLFASGLAADEPAAEIDLLSTGPRRFGDYELIEEVARGGMGVVFKARQLSLKRIVAVKMILRGEFASVAELARFRAEAETAARLQHPNIVAIHEVGECDGQHFFSMDYVEGRSLSDLVRDGPLPAPRAARYVEKIARAVHYAHEQGVLHRDLKPSNVLLDAHDEPHVTDFGLAKRLTDSQLSAQDTSQLTLSGQVVGTPSFMPPEQASGQRDQMGPRSDVYSLGAMLYQMLTGRPPFVGADAHTILAQVVGSDVIALRLLNPAAPRDLETIALKCLEKEPSRRYERALDLAEDLARHLNHEPIHAVPPSTIYRALKFVRRHRVGVAVAAMFVLVMTAATIVSATFGVRANRERGSAVAARNSEAAERIKAVNAEAGAQENARQARESAAEAQAVLGFLRDNVLAAARPKGELWGLGREATIKAALDAAEPAISNTFMKKPLVEAEIRQTLGLTYHYLGDDDLAIAQLERALEIQRADSKQGDGGATVMHNLGEFYRATGRFTNALSMLEQSIKLQEAKYGYGSPKILSTMNILAGTYVSSGQLSNAIALSQTVVALQMAARGAGDVETIDAINNLAEALSKAGRFEEALPMREQVLAGYQARLGPEHRKTLMAMNNLAKAQFNAKRPEDSITLFQKAIAGLERVLGPDHRLTLLAMDNLAYVLEKSGRITNAISLFDEVMRRSAVKLGPDDPDTLTSVNNLATSYQWAGRDAEAIRLLEDVVIRAKIRLGADHPDTLKWMRNLASAYNTGNRLTDAVPLFEQDVAILKSKAGPADPSTQAAIIILARAYLKTEQIAKAEVAVNDLLTTSRENLLSESETLADTLAWLSKTLLKQSKYTNAEPLLRKCLEIYEKKQPVLLSTTFTAQSLLGWALLGQKKFSEAESSLRQAYKGLKDRDAERPSPSHTQPLQEAGERLVQLYEAWNKPEKAAEWRQKISGSKGTSLP